MAEAAIPRYLPLEKREQRHQTPPGHRFGMYFACWESGRNWAMAKDNGKTCALKEVVGLTAEHLGMLQAIQGRQSAAAGSVGENLFRMDAKAISPFMTGTGMEHPLENGFAFLNPYGLPYLPGSGVKGVLRRAAEELAGVSLRYEFEDSRGWTREAVLDLFGESTGEDNGRIGALRFWDVFPTPEGDTLRVEIMTPHFAEYYQGAGEKNPSEDGQPNPIAFLAMPPGTRFTFHVECALERLNEPLAAQWKGLLQAAFEHAFDWLGFGAKTAVGYGHLQVDTAARKRREVEEERRREDAERARRQAEEAARLASLSPVERSIREVIDAAPPDQKPHRAVLRALENDRWQGEDRRAVALRLKAMMEEQNVWRDQSRKKKPSKDDQYQDTLKVMAILKSG